MYRYLLPNHRDSITSGSTYPGPATLLGALDVINTSATNSPRALGCGMDSILIPDARECIDPTLNVSPIFGNVYNLNLFPNPANGSITIAYNLNENSYIQFKVFDCIGREMITIIDEYKTAGYYSQQINISNFAKGVYLFTANINGECQTIKFIKI
jgi:Secretion system C-terminal sorting domain